MCFCTREEREAERDMRRKKWEKGSSTRMVSVSMCVENVKEPELADS